MLISYSIGYCSAFVTIVVHLSSVYCFKVEPSFSSEICICICIFVFNAWNTIIPKSISKLSETFDDVADFHICEI